MEWGEVESTKYSVILEAVLGWGLSEREQNETMEEGLVLCFFHNCLSPFLTTSRWVDFGCGRISVCQHTENLLRY